MAVSRQRLEEHRLADGGLAVLTRFGHKYAVTRTHLSYDQSPDTWSGLNKSLALECLATILRDDALEA